MIARITPHTLSGSLPAIASKSYAQRYLIAALLAEGATIPEFHEVGDDIKTTQNAVKALRAGAQTIDCASSATAARILLQVCAVRFPDVDLTFSKQLVHRPLETLIERPARAGIYHVSGAQSSQYLSGLLFALPLLDGESQIMVTDELQSSGYVEMTRKVLEQFSITSIPTAEGWIVPGDQTYRMPTDLAVEGDWSNAAYWLAAGVTVTGLRSDTLQPDGIALLPFCEKVGVAYQLRADFQLPDVIDVSQSPDLTPALAVMAATDGREPSHKYRITGTGRLRIKESDRIKSVVAMLSGLGAIVGIEGDDILIMGQRSLEGGCVDAHDDHRIVMATALASCWCGDTVTIEGAEAVTKSYPRFFDDFISLGGSVEIE